MKIFIVEDNIELLENIEETFEDLEFSVTSFKDGERALMGIEDFFDLYIVDINIPNVNGLELVKKIKEKDDNSKIFIISGDSNINTIISAYELGCNDYLKKPFDLREVVQKVKMFFDDKINNNIKVNEETYYNKEKSQLIHRNEIVKLTKKETLLFDLLIKNKGEIVPVAEIEQTLWGTTDKDYSRQMIFKLKKKLPFCDKLIENFSSNGYRIK